MKAEALYTLYFLSLTISHWVEFEASVHVLPSEGASINISRVRYFHHPFLLLYGFSLNFYVAPFLGISISLCFFVAFIWRYHLNLRCKKSTCCHINFDFFFWVWLRFELRFCAFWEISLRLKIRTERWELAYRMNFAAYCTMYVYVGRLKPQQTSEILYCDLLA